MNKLILPLFCMLALVACSRGGSVDKRAIQMPPGGQVAETVNGTPVPQSLLEAIAHTHNLDLDKPTQRDQALRILTDFVLLAQSAQRENFFAQPQFQAQVEAARLSGVAEASFAEFEQQTPLSDSVLKAEYDAQIARVGKQVYDFTQLLFANQDDALKAEDDLLSGKSFEQVFDAWRGKAKQAKSFTRVRLDQVPPALGTALQALHNGESTKTPVKTQFGWHVVHLDIANPFTPPPFDQLKPAIRRSMQMKIGQQRLAKLREQATITYPPGTTAPAAEPSAPAAAAVPTASEPAAPGSGGKG